MEEPAFRAALTVTNHWQAGVVYGPLLQKLNLTGEKAERLKDLIVSAQIARTDAANAALSASVTQHTNAAIYYDAIAHNRAEIDQRIESLLGEGDYQTYRDYDRTLPQREVVNQVQTVLSAGTQPLSPDQAEQLVTVLTSEGGIKPGAQSGLSAEVGAGLFPLPVFGISLKAVDRASGFLSPEQLAALKSVKLQQLAHRELLKISQAPTPEAK